MRSQFKIQKVIDVDGEDHCWCAREKVYHPCSGFRKRTIVDEYQPYCVECINLTSKGAPPIPGEDELRRSHELLSRIGYNPKSEESIHQQFKIKHNL